MELPRDLPCGAPPRCRFRNAGRENILLLSIICCSAHPCAAWPRPNVFSNSSTPTTTPSWSFPITVPLPSISTGSLYLPDLVLRRPLAHTMRPAQAWRPPHTTRQHRPAPPPSQAPPMRFPPQRSSKGISHAPVANCITCPVVPTTKSPRSMRRTGNVCSEVKQKLKKRAGSRPETAGELRLMRRQTPPPQVHRARKPP